MRDYELTPAADNDLEEIWHYIAQDNYEAADHLIDAFEEKFEMIARHPRVGRLLQKHRSNLHGLVFGNYMIFYRVGPVCIDIVRILHGARNIEDIFQTRNEESESRP